MSLQRLFQCPRDVTLEDLATSLPQPLELLIEEPRNRKLTLLDTFDWRLFQKGLVLIDEGAGIYLAGADLEAVDGLALEADAPRFVWDLPATPLRARLEPLLEMRALMPMAQVTLCTRTAGIRDDEQKAVVWMDCIGMTVGGKRVPEHLKLRAIRGYDQEFVSVCGFLDQTLKPTGKSLPARAYKAEGRRPGGYSGKLNLSLDPHMSAHEAARVIYKRLVVIIEANLDGLLKDIDTEFLHDFRVAVRRTRSGLSQIKGVLDSTLVDRAKVDFKTLGDWTNQLRDLDVYLLARDEYMALVPESMRPDLQFLFDHLANQRAKALSLLRRRLRSPRFSQILTHWKDDLEDLREPADAPDAHTPIFTVAGARIYKKYRTIRKMGLGITPDSPDASLHDLRIECKKLRYLLEFFSSLYEPEVSADLIKRLKQLQTVLGDFNDLHVQGLFLAEIAGELKTPADRLRPALLTLGMLMGRLYQRSREVKHLCLERVAGFLQEETHDHFQFFKRHAAGKETP